MKHLALILFVFGCASSAATPEQTHGGEGALEETTGGDGRRRAPRDAPATHAPSQSEESEPADNANETRCAAVSITPGLPPLPPSTPSTPALDALPVTYDASLAPSFALPDDGSVAGVSNWTRTVFAAWLREATARLQILAAEAPRVPAADAPYARAWLSRAYAVFVERFHSAPIPDSIVGDAEVRSMYTAALSDHTQPLLNQSLEMLQGVAYSGPWAPWKVEMTLWIDQEGCALSANP